MENKTTPLKAIRAKCLDCCCGSAKEVRLCTIPDCSLYPFRLGKNPFIKRTLTDAQKISVKERLSKGRDRVGRVKEDSSESTL